MLATKYTLKGEENFEKVKNEGKMYQDKDFGVIVLKKDNEEVSRFGFVISKKVDKLAVNRNRVKRAMSESVRRNMNDIEKGYDMIFLAKKSIMRESTSDIMKKVKIWIDQAEL